MIQLVKDYRINFRIANFYSSRQHIAKWLLKVCGDINISYYEELNFRNACMDCHLKVVKWLLKIKPNINIFAKNSSAFKFSSNRNIHILLKIVAEK